MIVFIVTFCLFTIEALLHYNYGYDLATNGELKFKLPEKDDLFKILFTVFIFSLLNSRIVKILDKYYTV
jgi:hypothetical protein